MYVDTWDGTGVTSLASSQCGQGSGYDDDDDDDYYYYCYYCGFSTGFPKVGSGLSSWPGNKLPKETQILSRLSSVQNLSQNSSCAKESGFLN